MPKLPDVTAYGPRATYSDPIIRSPGAIPRTGDLAGRAVMDVGRAMTALSKEIEAENERYDKVVAEDAFNRLREKQLDLTAGEDGYQKRRGEDAANKPIMEEYGKRYDEQVSRIADGLGNDRQKALLRSRAEVSGLEFRTGLLGHVTREREAFEKNTADRTIGIEMDFSVANFHDDGAQKMAKARIANTIIEYNNKRGYKTTVGEDGKTTYHPVVEDQLRTIFSRMDRNRIERYLVNDDDETAENLYKKQYKGSMTAEDTLAVEKALEVGSLRGKSLRAATELMDKHGGNFGLAAKEARTRFASNPKLLDATLQRIQSITSEDEAIKKLDDDRRITTAHDYVRSGKQMPATTEAALSPEARAFFNDPKNIAVIQGKEARTHDQAAYNEFMRLDRKAIANLKEEDFLTKYYYKVDEDSARRVAQIRDWSIEAAKKDPKAESLLRNDASLRQLVLGKVIEAGLIDAKKKTADYSQDDETMLNNAVAIASDQLEKLQVANGRKATVEEERAIVNGIVLKHAKVNVPKKHFGFFSGEKKVSELTPAERTTAYYTYKQVPVTDRDRLRQYAADLGISDPNDDRIAKAYTVLMQTKGQNISRADREARVAAILRGE